MPITRKHRLATPITVKLTIPIVIGFVILAILFTLLVREKTNALIEDRLTLRALEMAQSLIMTIEANSSDANVIRSTYLIASYSEVEAVYLVDKSTEKIIASSVHEFTNRPISFIRSNQVSRLLKAALDTNSLDSVRVDASSIGFYYHLAPITNDRRSTRPMLLFIQLDVTNSYNFVASFTQNLWGYFVVIMAVACWIFYWVSGRTVVQPLRRLLQAISESETNHKPILARTNSHDEIGVLIKAYNDLIISLYEQQRVITREKENSEHASRAKSEFLAVMTHEIRTPLNAIIGLSETLKNQLDDPLHQQQIHWVIESGKQLMHIVNDVLDFSKIEANKLELSLNHFKIEDMLDKLYHVFSVEAKKKKLTLQLDISSEPLPWLVGDSYRLQQILINLLSNAIKFTETGDIAIKLKTRMDGVNPNKLNLSIAIKDSGIGLSEDQIDQLFDKFTQVDNSSSRKYSGTGLGLAISKKLAEKMGGSIRVSSQLGKGSTFVVQVGMVISKTPPKTSSKDADTKIDNLSIQQIAPIDTQVHASQGNMPNIDNASTDGEANTSHVLLHILVVDDTPLNCIVVQNMLAGQPYQLQTAENGKDALDKATHNHYDVILMDCLMPSMDGYTATRLIRRHEEDEDIEPCVIIALTASALDETKQKCEQAGMNGFLTKPLSRTKLLDTLRHHCLQQHEAYEAKQKKAQNQDKP